MKKIILSVCFLSIISVSFGQRFLTCDICLSSNCTQPFSLTAGNTYTFSTSTATGALYAWSVSGGVTIVGSRNQSTVQVQAVTNGVARICLSKSVDGKDPCCVCDSIIVSGGGGGCCSLTSFNLTNTVNSDNAWCCDAAQNYLNFGFTNGCSGTATVTVTDLSFNVLSQYLLVPGGPVGFPNGFVVSNQNPPPCGTYLLSIVNDCNSQDVLGGFITVEHCNFGKTIPVKSTENIKMNVYPNPVTNSSLTVKITGIPLENKKLNSKLVFTLLDSKLTQKTRVWTFDNLSDQFTISTNGISKGVYFLITNIDGKDIAEKVIIQ